MSWEVTRRFVIVLAAVGFIGSGVLAHRALAQKPAKPADAAAPDKKQKKAEGDELQAVVKSVDAARRTVTVIVSSKDKKPGEEKVFPLAADAKVVLPSDKKDTPAEGKLSDVAEGARVGLQLSADGKSVAAIHLQPVVIDGVIKAVDAAKKTVTVAAGDKKPAEDRTFALAADVQISLPSDKKEPGQQGKLSDLAEGAGASLKLALDQKTVVAISLRAPTVGGIVKAVDAVKHTITVALAAKDKGQNPEEKTFDLAKDVQVVLPSGKKEAGAGEGKLTDLTQGTRVVLQLSMDRKLVVAIQAQAPKLTGALKALDVGRNALTIAITVNKDGPAEERTLPVAKDADVIIDGKQAKFTDLPLGAVLDLALSTDQKTVQGIAAGGRGDRGILKSVDANSITIGGKQGDHTYAVGGEVAVLIDGKAGKLAELPAEAVINVKLAADQKTALSVSAEGPSVKGLVKVVDADKNTITVTVQVDKNNTEDKTFDVAKGAPVATAINSVPLKLADLKAEKPVLLHMSADQKAVLRVTLLGE